MIALALGQVLMSFNVAALPVSLGGMVSEFGAPPTTVAMGVVMYGLAVAALVMAGAKIGQRVGWLRMFRIAVAVFAVAQAAMLLAPTITWVIAAQTLAGATAAIIVPALVALIAENYRGRQQATAIGSLGSARAASGVTAFFVGGLLGTLVGWRPVFGILLVLAVVVLVMSKDLRADRGDRTVKIDLVGAVLVGSAVVGLTLGVNNLNAWGILKVAESAPFSIVGLSPAIGLVVVGVVLLQAFVVWTRRRTARGEVPLLDLHVLRSGRERAAMYAMFVIVALEAALNFTVPLYTQIVQGRTPFDTALAMMPFNLTVFVAALLVVKFYTRHNPRQIAVFGFTLSTVALVWLSVVVTNNWETFPTILGLVVFGIGQGALVTLVFNVLVTASPKELAGDVGSLRGTTQNLASAVGTALASAILVALLGMGVTRAVADHPVLPDSIVAEAGLDSLDFVSNAELEQVLTDAGLDPDQVVVTVDTVADARLGALRSGLLVLAGFSALAIFPASRLPRYRPHEIPDPCPSEG
ncbi:MFS transporter [Sanguibacter sp. HDW7]|nr:MFS transporter [Sanguibacter sp. HDW7]